MQSYPRISRRTVSKLARLYDDYFTGRRWAVDAYNFLYANKFPEDILYELEQEEDRLPLGAIIKNYGKSSDFIQKKSDRYHYDQHVLRELARCILVEIDSSKDSGDKTDNERDFEEDRNALLESLENDGYSYVSGRLAVPVCESQIEQNVQDKTVNNLDEADIDPHEPIARFPAWDQQ